MNASELDRDYRKAVKTGESALISAGDGLYLRIAKNGTALWTAKKKVNGRTVNSSLGYYPELSLRQAREARESFTAQLRLTAVVSARYSVRDAYRDWAEVHRCEVKDFSKVEMRLNKYLLAPLGDVQFKDLSPMACISAWTPYAAAGYTESLRKVCNYVRQIATFVKNTGRAKSEWDLTQLKAQYPRSKNVKHVPAVTPEELPELFYQLEKKPRVYGVTWQCLMASLYILGRPGEMVSLEWDWVDFDSRIITFPAEIMKVPKAHEVPMSSQLVKLLEGMSRVSRFVFPSEFQSRSGEHINRESVRLLLAKAGLAGRQSAHGIRSIGRTWFANNSYDYALSELCLAHSVGSAVSQAYQRSGMTEQRRQMMQDWCDYVDRCRAEAHERICAERKS